MITLEPNTQLRFIKRNIPSIPTVKPFEFVNLEDVPTMLSNDFLIGEILLSTKPSTMIFYDLNIPEVQALKQSGKTISMKKVEDEKQIQFNDWQNYNKSTLGDII
ncbi:hypothetical protein ACHQM5_006274 [Ranunculus cassubicifolius]